MLFWELHVVLAFLALLQHVFFGLAMRDVGIYPMNPILRERHCCFVLQGAVPAASGSEKKKRRKKGGRGERDAEPAAAPAAPDGGSSTPPSMRIVSYFGHWICNCGKESALWDTCACGQVCSSDPLWHVLLRTVRSATHQPS